jgi:hypothetical protein
MRTLIQTTMDRLPGPWDTVLVLGAGAGSSLPLLRRLAPRRMLLVEPEPDQARLLERTIEQGRGEAVLSLAVAGTEVGEAILHLCNTPRFNSLSRPTGLAQMLPNLREVGVLRVPASPLRAIAASEGLDASGRNLLIVESVGQLSGVLADSAALGLFSALIVKAGEEPLFADDTSLPELRVALAEAGFDRAGVDPEAIYPIAVELFLRNDARAQAKVFQAEARHAAVECERLEAERAAQQRLAEQRAAELEQGRQEVASLQAALAEAGARLAASLDAHVALETALGKERDELAANLAEAQQAREQQADEIQRLRQETGALKAALDKARAELAQGQAEHEARLASLGKERDALAAEARQQTAQEVGRLRQEAEALKAALDKSQAELAAARSEHEARNATLTKERDEQAKLVIQHKADLDKVNKQNQERGARIAQLEKEHVELSQRQALLDQEMIRAEAQIDLIKDVLLRDPAL